jgi:hypothetical protein
MLPKLEIVLGKQIIRTASILIFRKQKNIEYLMFMEKYYASFILIFLPKPHAGALFKSCRWILLQPQVMAKA